MMVVTAVEAKSIDSVAGLPGIECWIQNLLAV